MLSVKQPWADFITDGRRMAALLAERGSDVAGLLPKTVENRTWSTRWRGTLVIHASLQPDMTMMKACGLHRDDFVYGAIVGTAVLVDVITGSPSPWAQFGQKHWVLRDAMRLPTPAPCRGHLMLRPPPPGILTNVIAQYALVA